MKQIKQEEQEEQKETKETKKLGNSQQENDSPRRNIAKKRGEETRRLSATYPLSKKTMSPFPSLPSVQKSLES